MYALTYLDKPLVKSASSALRIKIGTCLAGMTNPYDAEKNFQNTALSGRIMYAMQGEMSGTYQFTDYLQLRTGITITHFSNGALKLPNSGVNIPALKLGVSYQSRQPQIQPVLDTVYRSLQNSISLNISGAFFYKEVKLPGGKKYPGGSFPCTLIKD